MSKKTILITGAGGNIGHEVINFLLMDTENYKVRVFELPTPRNREYFDRYDQEVEVYYGDISKPEDSIKACMGVDTVIHLAAVIPPLAYDHPELVKSVNIEGTRNLIENLKANSPNAFFCFASSVAVYGDRVKDPMITVNDPVSPSLGDNYAASKIEMEELIRNSGLCWTIFRLSAIFGVSNHKMSPIMFYVPLDTQMEITSPRDTARAFSRVAAHREELIGRTFNLGGGEENRVEYKDFLEQHFEIAGLGSLDFPKHAFATQNSHCGLYADGDELENILHFRQDTVDQLYRRVNEKTPWLLKMTTKGLSKVIKSYLLSKSEPYKAWQTKDPEMMQRFFGHVDNSAK